MGWTRPGLLGSGLRSRELSSQRLARSEQLGGTARIGGRVGAAHLCIVAIDRPQFGGACRHGFRSLFPLAGHTQRARGKARWPSGEGLGGDDLGGGGNSISRKAVFGVGRERRTLS